MKIYASYRTKNKKNIDRTLFILFGLCMFLCSRSIIRRVKLLVNQTGILHFLALIDWNEFGFK